jgi:hypothetical protein
LQGLLSVDQFFSHAVASGVMPSPDDESCYTFPEGRNVLWSDTKEICHE